MAINRRPSTLAPFSLPSNQKSQIKNQKFLSPQLSTNLPPSTNSASIGRQKRATPILGAAEVTRLKPTPWRVAAAFTLTPRFSGVIFAPPHLKTVSTVLAEDRKRLGLPGRARGYSLLGG
jgi:hypothetical protein